VQRLGVFPLKQQQRSAYRQNIRAGPKLRGEFELLQRFRVSFIGCESTREHNVPIAIFFENAEQLEVGFAASASGCFVARPATRADDTCGHEGKFQVLR